MRLINGMRRWSWRTLMTRCRNEFEDDAQVGVSFWILRLLALALTVVYNWNLVSLELGVALIAGYSLLFIIVAVVVSLRRG